MTTTDKPTLQDFHIEGVRHITPVNALAAVKKCEALLLDVREENEWKLESIPLDDVYYQPMSLIMDRLSFIPRDKAIITFCPGGVRSTKVANLLNIQGFKDVVNLDGGFTMWKSQGLPFESNLSFGCGCGCSK
jgi:hydroxyacylglutathione hydrolase